MTPIERMQKIDVLLSHVWMVRAFLKHSDEAKEDDELCEVHRALYDFMLALGKSLSENDAANYLRRAQKKYSKLRRATELFIEIQPEISGHTNFNMASRSLAAAVDGVGELLKQIR